MAAAGTAAVLLPGAFLTLGETRRPPVDALRDAGVPIALASDCNPGTSPLCSARLAMGLGARLFEQSRATRIVHGAKPAVETEHGVLRANKVILAGNVGRSRLALDQVQHDGGLALRRI